MSFGQTSVPSEGAPPEYSALLANIRLGYRSLPGTNTSAYLPGASVTEIISLITLILGRNHGHCVDGESLINIFFNVNKHSSLLALIMCEERCLNILAI
jgi:hypothetical protein